MNMAGIGLEDIVYTSIVSVLAAIQLARFAKGVGKSRMKHKVTYPNMTGDVNFERVIRAQQNCLEFFPIFMIVLWTSGLFFNQVASAVVGVVYIYSRQQYVKGYTISVQDRLPGFYLGVKCILAMSGMAVAGILTVLLRMHTGVDLGGMARAAARTYLKVDLL